MNIYLIIFFILVLVLILVLTFAIAFVYAASRRRYYYNSKEDALGVRFDIALYYIVIWITRYAFILLFHAALICLALSLIPVIEVAYSVILAALSLVLTFQVVYETSEDIERVMEIIVLEGDIKRASKVMIDSGVSADEVNEVLHGKTYDIYELEDLFLALQFEESDDNP